MNTLKNNLLSTLKNIQNFEKKHSIRENSVQLLAVSKKHPAEAIRTLYQTGQIHFGENFVQEALSKQDQLKDCSITWHFIGPIQSNKTKDISNHFQWIHSIDRIKIAKRLNEQRLSQTPLNICIQVNISEESTKSGVLCHQAIDFAHQLMPLKHLKLRGLMAIPQRMSDFTQQQAEFKKLSDLYRQLNNSGFQLDTLSMGMSKDIEAAISMGSTMVRVGTAIFGERKIN